MKDVMDSRPTDSGKDKYKDKRYKNNQPAIDTSYQEE